MKKKLFGWIRKDNKGLALISVLGLVTLATILILALFSLGQQEHKSARINAAGTMAKQFADNAVNIVIGQIQAGAEGVGAVGAAQTLWASQPGAIRTYGTDGIFRVGRKLYSDDDMVVTTPAVAGETLFSNDSTADQNFGQWASFPDQYVDLNDPVVNGTDIYFPILDPRAAVSIPGGLGAVDGFEYYQTTGSQFGLGSTGGGAHIDGVVLGATGAAANNSRLPMPVQWLYFLRDGNTGVVDGAGNFQGPGGPSIENPIIGRVAFWADDETCKVNINTAGEPSTWNVPTVTHMRDGLWADSPPTFNEFQRYPGHPATVALSAVLGPESTVYTPNTYPKPSQAAINFKNAIYTLAPRIAAGGSEDGTRVFAVDDSPNKNVSSPVLLADAFDEHPFASVDEIMFNRGMGAGNKRALNTLNFGTTNLLTPQGLASRRGFLTASSKASELNMFSLPRIAIWPVPVLGGNRIGDDYRTSFDTMIASSAELSGQIFYFQRLDSHSSLADIGRDPGTYPGLARNKVLMDYLHYLIKQTMPGGTSFFKKYAGLKGRNDADQVLVEIFDYIRSTNLFDGQLANTYRKNKDYRAGANLNEIPVFEAADELKPFYTYTEPRFTTPRGRGNISGLPTTYAYNEIKDVETGMYPYHGQVKPSDWVPPGDQQEYKGFGRFPTVSEIALQFICTGDGYPDAGSYNINGVKSGGKTAEKLSANARANTRVTLVDPRDSTKPQYWYSNIPPFPSKSTFESWGCDFSTINSGLPTDPTRHPGWNASNWNGTLEWNETLKAGIPLGQDEKRVQVALIVEVFVPAAGWTKYAPEFTLTLDNEQLSSIKVEALENGGTKEVSLFSSTESRVYKSGALHMSSINGLAYNGVNPMGGSYGTEPFMGGRSVKSIGHMPDDSNYVKPSGKAHADIQDFSLVSSMFTVKRNLAGTAKPNNIKLKGGGKIQMKLYSSHNYQGGGKNKTDSIPVQTINFKFPSTAVVPVPHLVVYSTERQEETLPSTNTWKILHACRWWSFSKDGAVGRWTGRGNSNTTDFSQGSLWTAVRNSTAPEIDTQDTYGRFQRYSTETHSGTSGSKSTSTSTSIPHALSVIYGYANVANYSGVKANRKGPEWQNRDSYSPSGDGKTPGAYPFYGTDSVRSIVPRHGDYRVLAGMKEIPEDMWVAHRVWEDSPDDLFAHNLNSFSSGAEVGYDLGGNANSPNGSQTEVADNRLMQGVWYPANQIPDAPNTTQASAWSSRMRDFDNGPGNMRDGAYINKSDDGNLSVMDLWFGTTGKVQTTRNAYFVDSQLQLPSTDTFFTPNRMIAGPGVFGSLSTGVYGSNPGTEPNSGKYGVPWRTLLFRASLNEGHIGAPSYAGGAAPADHYFMDLYWMPVVEPYPMSVNYSSAGKINLNWQLLPFSHIRRESALRAAIKGETLATISQTNVASSAKVVGKNPNSSNRVQYKQLKSAGGKFPLVYWSESDSFYWNRNINVPETLRQLEERFTMNPGVPTEARGLMRTASQLCELHLIPESSGTGDGLNSKGVPYKPTNRTRIMNTFWGNNKLTGDNSRERTYTNIYQKITTKSNTYRVHFIAQSILKAKSIPPNKIDTGVDTVTSTYRGSALIERYLPTTISGAPIIDSVANGFAPTNDGTSLEKYHRYKILEMKQFIP